jgi:hypothetical protein
MAELNGKSLQQDLFVKKLWFHALKTRGKQRERELQEAGEAESGTVKEPPQWMGTVVKDAKRSSATDESSRHCFVLPANGIKVSSPEWEPIATSFAENGVVLLKDAAEEPEARMERVASAAAFVQHRLAALRAVAADAGAGAEDHRLKTVELVRRSPGRYDLVVETDPDLNEGRGAPILALREGAPWLPFVRRVLGADARLIHAGCVCSLPGSAVQGIHRDGKHLFSSGELGGSVLPTHCLTVFVPLVPLTAAVGPTQFWPGTHVTFGDAPRATSMSGSVTFAAPESSGVQDEVVAVPGDAIVFDYRILHRGLANISDQARPLAYFTFAKPWFRDATNYTKTSLFEDDNDSEETFHESSTSAKLMAAPGISKGELAEGNGVIEPTGTHECPSVIISVDDDVDD